MKEIEVLYFEGCPSHEKAVDLVTSTVQRLGVDARVTDVEVPTPEDAERLCFPGSPTVRVDGVDIEPRNESSFGLCCRMYETPDGRRGVPPVELLEDALR